MKANHLVSKYAYGARVYIAVCALNMDWMYCPTAVRGMDASPHIQTTFSTNATFILLLSIHVIVMLQASTSTLSPKEGNT